MSRTLGVAAVLRGRKSGNIQIDDDLFMRSSPYIPPEVMLIIPKDAGPVTIWTHQDPVAFNHIPSFKWEAKNEPSADARSVA